MTDAESTLPLEAAPDPAPAASRARAQAGAQAEPKDEASGQGPPSRPHSREPPSSPRASDGLAGDALAELVAGVLERAPLALGRAVSLIESSLEAHRADAASLLDALAQHALAHPRPSRHPVPRVLVTGAPGAGKSCFLDRFALAASRAGQKTALSLIDPSSPTGGGSLLGDSTRMTELQNKAEDVFIRPSPSGTSQSGLAWRSYDTFGFFELAGFDLVLGETSGIGQSATELRESCDFLLLLVPPASGDTLQGLKRGVVELCDFLIITKQDGATEALARQAYGAYQTALALLGGTQELWSCSALEAPASVEAIYERVWERWHQEGATRVHQRAHQRAYWLEKELQTRLLNQFFERHAASWTRVKKQIAEQTHLPLSGERAQKMLETFWTQTRT